MEKVAHVLDKDVVDVSKQFITWVISEFPRTESIEATYSADESTLLGDFVVDECGDRTKSDEPCSLYEVHLLE